MASTRAGWPEPWYRDPWQWFARSFGVVLIAIPIWVLLPKGWADCLTVTNWIAIAGAVSSLAVAGAALWLGLSNTSRANRESMVKARIVAAQAEIVLTATITRFYDLERHWGFRNLHDPRPVDTFDAAMTAFSSPIEAVDREALSLLAPLPNHCATRIARAFALLEHTRSNTLQLLDLWGMRGIPDSQMEHLLRKWGASLAEAMRLLHVTQRVCDEAALEGAPSPSGQELWGDE